MDLEYLEINGYDFVHEDGWIFGIVLLEVSFHMGYGYQNTIYGRSYKVNEFLTMS